MNALRATPSLPVADIPAAEAFLRDSLGFEVIRREDRHVFGQRDAAFVRLTHGPFPFILGHPLAQDGGANHHHDPKTESLKT